MRLHDTPAGLLTLIFGAAVVAFAQTFPSMPGQHIGPALFPTLIGGALVLCGAALAWSGRRQRGTAWLELEDWMRRQRDAAWLELEDWMRRPRMVLNAALVIGDLIFYALAVDTLGFFVTGFVFLTVLFGAFRVSRRWLAPLAAGTTLGLHFAFYTLLRVPLPWGWLEAIAW